VVANSHYAASSWRGAHAGGLVPRVAHPPVDLDRHRGRDRTAARARLGISDDDPVLGVVAQITPWKGQETAIRALAAIRRFHPRARLLLVGQTLFVDRATRYDNRAYLESLKRTIGDLGLDRCVRFLGQRDDVPDLLSALDVLLVPSSEEPFGLVILEAMAAGTPVVATNRGGPGEIIRDGVSGRLVTPDRTEPWARAVAELLSSAQLREQIVREGLLTAHRFSIPHYVESFEAVYREAVS
jgi:glycosyltransferase involved in cell wall biosynthesis